MTDFEKYQLQWMMDHGHTLEELMCELQDMQYDDPEDSDRIATPVTELFQEWVSDRGFGSEIWPCEREFNEAEHKEADRAPKGRAVYANIEKNCCSRCGTPIPTDSALDTVSELDIGYCYGCGARLVGKHPLRIRFEFTELGESNEGNSGPSVFELEKVKSVADVEDALTNTLRMYVELNGIPQGTAIRVDSCISQYTSMDAFLTSQEQTSVVHIDTAVRTDEPSKYVIWGSREPHIFTVDKESFAWSYEK